MVINCTKQSNNQNNSIARNNQYKYRMGIQYLNKFLLDNCQKSSIRKIHLQELRHKTIAIDTSIYLYKFVSDNTLIESLYLLISILKKYAITPVFIFDGKPPIEKRELLIRRRLQEQDAEKKYLEMKSLIETTDNIEDIQKLQGELDSLKRQFISISYDDIENSKKLMEYYGIKYYVAQGEADSLIAHLVKTNKVWGCLSDDMDMLVYGCSRVYRHISLLNHTVIYYDTKAILNNLEMTPKEFCEIMVLSGTDYNIHSKTSIHETMKLFTQYKKHIKKNKNVQFYEWTLQNSDYIVDIDLLMHNYDIFCLKDTEEFKDMNNISLKTGPIQKGELQAFLKNYGFLFC